MPTNASAINNDDFPTVIYATGLIPELQSASVFPTTSSPELCIEYELPRGEEDLRRGMANHFETMFRSRKQDDSGQATLHSL